MTWEPTHRSIHDGSDARLLSPGWNAEGWGTLENEKGDRWRDERLDWAVIVPSIIK